MKDLSNLEKKFKIKFNDIDLLKQSLVHRSYINENPSFRLDHNERLEFLGDAVLELIITEHLYKNYSNPEGELTNWRASLVNSNMLAKLAKKLDLEDYLYLSKGEAKDSNSKARHYILANAFEAVIGAIYLDQGLKASKSFIKDNVIPELPHILSNQLYLDPKSKFQEIAQEKSKITPTYKVLKETGPDHNKKFQVGVYLDKELIATSTGFSKQEAQVKAAERALSKKKWS
ncbi:MAG: ribonuclease III [Candidatus Buchananbacteria bacterium RIFCSPHIGHO2_02_FULL_38_8]|uniref:Ribonuclease 3 n=2 Tax=Candidatus Buchananiibacteriota TaxID=1817903 RepID=A0A1G1XTB9_9BACT|nr:MAG: ribonuclease III [Candidatus Buchananbacteria bacterium RIFCSPHIGHO2_01_FULL_39_8]OGY46977.1 MAG: ribonuclease III [Candidatus Buchananbacteria bacterium RIFCSPHIGHO2_02_FULL_38_8]